MSTVSLCMIVRNEEKVLEKCLKSIVDLADEIVIVDTGSTDKTIEIAKKFVDQVYSFQWIDDFAAARNYAESLATCDYILRFDADCTLQSGDMAKILKLKDKGFDGADLIQFNFVEHFEIEDNKNIKPLFEESTVYLHKAKKLKWQQPIHEYLQPIDLKKPIKIFSDNSIVVLHHRAESKKDWRIKQNLSILKKSVQSRDQNYNRMMHFYGRDLYFDCQYNESIKQFKKLLETETNINSRAYAIDKIFFGLFYSNLHDRIVEFKHLLQDSDSPMLVLLAADVSCLSNPVEAQKLYLKYLRKPFIRSVNSFEHDVERFMVHPYIQLGKISIQQNNPKKAKEYLQIALQKAILKETKNRIILLSGYC